MKHHLYIIIAIVLCSLSCASNSKPSLPDTGSKFYPKTTYAIDPDNDGIFDIIELPEEVIPQPIQGKVQWQRDFGRLLKYPAEARKKSISGDVVLEILIDENGTVQDVKVIQQLSQDCDAAARQAYINSTLQGYSPLSIQGRSLSFKKTTVVSFNLH